MERAERVLEEARGIIEEGEKPSVAKISARTGMSPADVHRCLNHLESAGRVSTYTSEAFGNRMRMVGVNR